MEAARALEIELELRKEIPSEFYTSPVQKEDGRDRAAYEAMKAVQKYRSCLLMMEAEYQNGLDCVHDICPVCGAHLDTDEVCDCEKGHCVRREGREWHRR